MSKPYFLGINFCAQMATPSAPGVTPTGADNGVTYSYKVVGIDANGNHGIASSAGTNAHGPTALSNSNFETVTWTDPAGAAFVDVYRTVGGATQGKIARVAAGVQTLADQALVGDAGTAPATDTSGIGTDQQIGQLNNVGVQLSGTFVGTIQIQGNLTADDTAWFNVGSAQTGVALVTPSSQLLRVRAKCTAYTSGTPVITVGGHA